MRNCLGNVITTDTNVFKECKIHLNLPDYGKNEGRYTLQHISKQSILTRDSSRNIVDDAITSLNIDSYRHIPKYKSLVEKIRRTRKANTIIPYCKNDIPESIRRTGNGELFYLYDSGDVDNDRVIIFSTSCNVVHLENSSVWICDGTFRSCPSSFEQLYTIIATVKEKHSLLCMF